MKNSSGLEFTDISSEAYRDYNWENFMVRVNFPMWLNVSKSGGHRLLDANGLSWYIVPGFKYIQWRNKEGEPNFVK